MHAQILLNHHLAAVYLDFKKQPYENLIKFICVTTFALVHCVAS